MPFDFYDVFVFLSGAVFSLPLIIFLSKKSVNYWLGKLIESHKQRLSSETERLKADLSIYAHEKNIRISRSDQQMSKAIADLYSVIVLLMKPTIKFINDNPDVVTLDEVLYEKEQRDHCIRDEEELRVEKDFFYFNSQAELIRSESKNVHDKLIDVAIFVDVDTFDKIESFLEFLKELYSDCLSIVDEENRLQGHLDTIFEEFLSIRDNRVYEYRDLVLSFQKDIVSSLRKKLESVEI